MNGLRTIAKEFAYQFGSIKRAIPIAAILFIPILYAGTFLWAFWDPYGHLNRLPVAVVNEDSGASFHGQTIDAGQQLVNQLRHDDSLGFEFVSAKQAKQGFADNRYDMVITIPKQFSSEAANAATQPGAPQPQLESITNDKHNYIAGIIGRNAMQQLKEKTAQQLAKTYTTNLVNGLAQIQTGVAKASHGATQISSGAASLVQANAQLVSGGDSVAAGSASLAQHLAIAQTAAQKVASGLHGLSGGSQQLHAGMESLNQAATQLRSGTQAVYQNVKSLNKGLTSATVGANQEATAAAQLASGLQAYEQSHPNLQSDSTFQKLVQASQSVSTGAGEMQAADTQLQQGTAQLVLGTGKLKQGMDGFAPKLQQAQASASALSDGEKPLVTGSNALVGGISQLHVGAVSLTQGAMQLQTGITSYTTGASQVAQGVNALSMQLQQANNRLPVIHKQQMVSATANPVGVSQVTTGNIANYGNGFAPYFLSLGLFVGALLMTIVVPFRDPPERPNSAFGWFVSKSLLVAGVAVVQSLIADAVLLFGLGVHANNRPAFVLFSILLSLTFVALVQLFVTVLENPGRFLVVIILILQLTTSSGTYPVVLSPAFFQHLAPYLPMNYAVDGLRYLVGGGNASLMISDVWYLFVYWGVFLALTFVYFLVRYRKDYQSEGMAQLQSGVSM